MAHESPIMKAMRDFALADPEDCEREWAAYLALVSGKEAASDSSPMNSTSSLAPAAATKASPTTSASARPHIPRNAAPISNPTTPDASHAVLNAKRYSSKDDLTPGARRPASTASLHAQGGDVSTTSPAVAASASISTWPATKDDLTPGARRIYNLLVGGSSAPASAASKVSTVPPDPITVDSDATDLAVSVHVNCSTECPSHDDSVSVPVLISSATQASSMTIGDVLSELAAPMVGDKALNVDAMSDTTPTTAVCLPASLDDSICREDLVAMSLTLWSAPTSFSLLPGSPPSSSRAPMDVLEPFMWSSTTCSTIRSGSSLNTPPSLLAEAYKAFNEVPTATPIVPWPPPSWTRARPPLICGQELVQHAQQKCGTEFSVMDSKGNWNAAWLDVELKPPWPFRGAYVNLPMANEILDVSSWPWVTSKHAEVQFQFSYPLLPVNCHFARLYFPLSRRAQMNLESNCGTSLNLFVYCGYPILNTAYTCPSMFIIIGLLPPYGFEANVVLMLISWFPMPHLQLFPGLLGAVHGCISSNSSAFLTILIGVAELQQHYTCTRVLPLANCKVWIPYHILQGSIFDMAIAEWKTWASGIYHLEICLSVFGSGPGVPLFWWLQFVNRSSFCFRDELLCTITIQLQPWPSWELFPCITVVTSFITGSATHLGSQIFDLQIPWYIAWLLVKPSCAHLNFGDNGGLIMHFTITSIGLHPTKIICCSLLIQWPGILISAKASFYEAVQNGKNLMGAEICSMNWQNITNLQNHCWNGWSSPLLVPAYLKLEPSPFGLVNFLQTSSMCANWENGGWCYICLVLRDDLLYTIPDLWTIENGFNGLQKYWDPGGVKLQLCEKVCLIWLVMPWDPGDSIGLGSSRVLRRRDCQRPGYWAGWWAAALGPWPVRELHKECTEKHILEKDSYTGPWLGTERKGGFGRGLAKRV